MSAAPLEEANGATLLKPCYIWYKGSQEEDRRKIYLTPVPSDAEANEKRQRARDFIKSCKPGLSVEEVRTLLENEGLRPKTHKGQVEASLSVDAPTRRLGVIPSPTPAAELICPISLMLMTDDPVVAADGHTYERAQIEAWFQKHQKEIEDANREIASGSDSQQARAIIERGVLSPVSREKMPNLDLVSNIALHQMARDASQATAPVTCTVVGGRPAAANGAGPLFLQQAATTRPQPIHHEAPTRDPLRELSPITQRAKSIRASLTRDIFQNQSTTPNSKATAKTAREKIVFNSPSTRTIIEDSLTLAWNTPMTKNALLDNYRVAMMPSRNAKQAVMTDICDVSDDESVAVLMDAGHPLWHQMNKDPQDMRNEIARKQEERARKQEDADNMTAKIANAEEEIARMKETADNLTAQIANVDQEITRLKDGADYVAKQMAGIEDFLLSGQDESEGQVDDA